MNLCEIISSWIEHNLFTCSQLKKNHAELSKIWTVVLLFISDSSKIVFFVDMWKKCARFLLPTSRISIYPFLVENLQFVSLSQQVVHFYRDLSKLPLKNSNLFLAIFTFGSWFIRLIWSIFSEGPVNSYHCCKCRGVVWPIVKYCVRV